MTGIWLKATGGPQQRLHTTLKQVIYHLCNNISIKPSDLIEMPVAGRSSISSVWLSWTVVQCYSTLTIAMMTRSCSVHFIINICSKRKCHTQYITRGQIWCSSIDVDDFVNMNLYQGVTLTFDFQNLIRLPTGAGEYSLFIKLVQAVHETSW